MPIDPRFMADAGREVFTGNELLVKGALETEGGVHLLTGYPGSPVAGFFDVCGDLTPCSKNTASAPSKPTTKPSASPPSTVRRWPPAAASPR